MSNLFTFSYWFSLYPGAWLSGNAKIVSGFFGLVVIIGLLAWWTSEKNKENKLMSKFWNKVKNACLTVGLVGLLLVFARQQRITFLSMPFLLALNVAGGIIWAFFIFRYVTKEVPVRKKEIEEKKEKEKYLP